MMKCSLICIAHSMILLIILHDIHLCDASPKKPVFKHYHEKFEFIDINFTEPIIEIPAEKNHTATIIFLHGLAQTANNTKDVLEHIRKPYMKLVLPTANYIPVTTRLGTMMSSWFDVLEDGDGQDDEGIEHATAYVHSLIDKEIKNGIPPERILVGGYSQGGALAFHSAITYPKTLAGCLGFTVWPQMPVTAGPRKTHQPVHPSNKDLPFLYINDKHDEINYEDNDGDNLSQDEADKKKRGPIKKIDSSKFGLNRKFISFTGIEQPITDEQMDDIDFFFKKYLPPK